MIRKKSLLFIFNLCLLLFFTADAKSIGTFHAVLVAATEDRTIGDVVEKDLRKVKRLVQSISKYTGLKLNEKTITGNNLNYSNVIAALDMSISKEDVVFFYYSGHGARTYHKKTKWPSLALEGMTTPVNKLLDLDIIIAKIQEKNPRFFMVIADTCNNPVEGEGNKNIEVLSASKNYQELFLKYYGHIIASSSKPGQKSWGNNTGSFFTNNFLNQLSIALRSQKVANWHSIMDESERVIQIPGTNKVQTPQSDINISLNPIKYSQSTSPPSFNKDFRLKINILPNKRIKIGQEMQIGIDSNQNGYVMLFDVDYSGEINLFYPNQYCEDAHIKANEKITIPEMFSGFSLVAKEIGKRLIIGLLINDKSQALVFENALLAAFDKISSNQIKLSELNQKFIDVLAERGLAHDYEWYIDISEYEVLN